MSRVLVVDDKEENLYYLQKLLEGHGYEVQTAHHGAEALAIARQSVPELVISDLLMPVMDGYTLLRHFRHDERLKNVPFVVYTATYTEPEDERLALALGADAFILKPTEPDEFVARIAAVEAAPRRQRAAPPAASDEETLLRQYSETLIRKLEDKSLELEESNRSLQADIAARERVEAALRDSEERFRQLAENIDDVFWLSDLEQKRFFYVSPAYDEIWGRSRERLYTNPGEWLDAVHPDDRAAARALTQADAKRNESFRVRRPDGSLRWIRSRAYPVRDHEGNIYRLAGVFRDVTEYTKLEEQLRQAQKMEAVGRVAGSVAHDFNNLLSVILTYTTLVRDRLAPGEIRDDVEETLHAAERATELTRQLLAFSRRQVLRASVVEVDDVVRRMEKMIRRLLGENIELCLRLAVTTNGRVIADPNQLEQIIMNLVVNARDAMPSGGTLTIETRDVTLDAPFFAGREGGAPGPYVMLTVTDTGVGMDPATRDRVFEPFFTTKEQGKGTGLGLSTVFGIVKESGGQVIVESEAGSGATFRIYLPRTDHPAPSAHANAPEPPTLGGSETILLVEDDEQVRQMARAILERNGYRVLDAQNGGEAFLVSEQFQGDIHLLLTDVVMPRMNGPELARRLIAARPGMRVLYVSGYADERSPSSASEANAGFLQKPITPLGLLRKVRDVLAAPA